jgi:Pyruvate/2-oxoacid:ferredoxin oxidoreductase delta subunit
MQTQDARVKTPQPHWCFQLSLDRCIGCGICMDTCPVRALDMSRPTAPGVDGTGPYPWMTEQPVQVRHCIGCWVCRTECPTDAIAIMPVASEPEMSTLPPLPAGTRNDPDRGWIPLSALTRDGTRDPVAAVRRGSWGDLPPWKLAPHGRLPWQVWRSWMHGAGSPQRRDDRSRKEA